MWNYRVTKKFYSDPDTWVYGIREVYYNDDGEIERWTKYTVGPYGNTVDELVADIANFVAALAKPVVEIKAVDGQKVAVEDDLSEHDLSQLVKLLGEYQDQLND
jgi:hypothetical protein